MKKSIIYLTLLFLTISSVFAQDKAYFQQKVGFVINVTLNDMEHSLQGDIDISYTNNSTDNLSFIYMHLWPNAYKNQQTAFAIQAKENGSAKDFFYAEAADKGFIDELDFLVDGKSISWNYDPEHIDIAILNLPKPLKPGETINISTPFRVKIPQSVSRLGHVEQSYQITQWYPKPAVYDHKGWHPMPYLDQGEFYSEYGDFEVSITLPSNYVVGATGELQEKTELEFLNRKAEETSGKSFKKPFDGVKSYSPAVMSSEETKTISYKASNVHDFAWFADKRFHVVKDQIELKSGKKVDTWVMFTNFEGHLWKDAINYVNRSVKFYSDHVGEYPYPQATAVQSALSAGGGMEYPMITVIGESNDEHSLDIVITHEVGHNWFYGILGSNERDHPWMDEGMNSFYEKKYDRTYYKDRKETVSDYLPDFLNKLVGSGSGDLGYISYLTLARKNEIQAIETPSQDLVNINYWLSAYDRPAGALHYLETYLGEDVFKSIMNKYFNQWGFRHPYPEDFQKLFETETGKDLTWFFDGLLAPGEDKKIDYAVKGKNRNEVTVVNKQSINGPFSISILKDKEIVATEWHDGFSGAKVIPLPAGDHDEIQLDAIEVIPEINRKNNGQKRPLKVSLLANVEDPQKRSINITPMIGFNNYDKFMIGAAFHNTNIIPQKFEYIIAPMFATGSIDKSRKKALGSADIVGMADFKFNRYFKSGPIKKFSPGIGLKSFNFLYNERFDYHEKYIRINPYLEIEFRKKKPRGAVSQSLRLSAPIILEQDARLEKVDTFQFFGYNDNLKKTGVVLNYQFKKKGLHPIELNPFVEYRQVPEACDLSKNEGYLRVGITGKYKYHYVKNRALKIRFHGSALLTNNHDGCGARNELPLTAVARGGADYYYDDYYIGRSQGFTTTLPDNFWSQQINPNREGGFRVPIPAQSKVGQSDIALLAVNLTVDLPFNQFNLPIKPYLDMGFYGIKDNPSGIESPLLLDFGVAIELGEILGIYVPIAGTKNLMNANKSLGGFFNRIGFKIDLHKANPKNILDSISF